MKSSAWLKRLLIMSLITQIFPVICGAQTPTPLPTPTPTSYFQWPRADQRVNSTLGSFRSKRFHLGLDLKRAEGQAVYPSADGVIRTKEMIEGSGFTITVEHDNGLITNYLHLIIDYPPQFPDLGESVTQFDQIGQVGGTGGSGAVYTPHLHFEIRDVQPGQTPKYESSGDAHNPLNYLPPR